MDSVEVLDEPDIHFVDSHDGSCGAYLKMATVFGQKNKNLMTFHAEIPEALYGETYPSEL